MTKHLSTPEERLARRLMRLCDRGALATLIDSRNPTEEAGLPYASLVLVASDLDGSPILMLSDLADHSRNIAADQRVSLLLAPASNAEEPLAEARLTLVGEAVADGAQRLKQRFLDRHPSAALYAGFTDFRCYRLSCRKAHLVAGFGRIRWLKGEQLLLGAEALAFWPEASNLARQLNVDETGLVERLGASASGSADSWRLSGIDPEGCDFKAGGRTARLDFPSKANSPAAALAIIRRV